MAVKNLEGYLGCGVPTEERSQIHTGLAITNHWCQEEESLQYLAVKISEESVQVRAAHLESQAFLLKGPPLDLLTDGLTCNGLSCSELRH